MKINLAMKVVCPSVLLILVNFGFTKVSYAEQKTYGCEQWNWGTEWRCNVSKGPGNTANINIQNRSGQKVTYAYTEFHSYCNFGGGVVQRFDKALNNGSDASINLLSAGTGITCREVFITGCRGDNGQTGCPSLLSVTWTTRTGSAQ